MLRLALPPRDRADIVGAVGTHTSMRSRWVQGLLLGAVAVGWSAAAQERPRPFVPVTDEMLWKPNPADWLMWRRTLDSHGFSPLDQIDRSNVAQLKMVWSRGMGAGNVERPRRWSTTA